MSRRPKASAGPVRTLAVFCPDWPVTALGPSRPELVAVIESDRLTAASEAARRAGVRPGLRSREAQSRCPGLVVVRRDLPAEVRAFEPVLTALEVFGAPVASSAPGWAGFATRGPARYFGGESELVAHVAASLAGLGLGERWWGVGIGDGSFVATQAARQGTIVAPGEGASFVAPLDVAALERPELAEVLHRLGVHTLGAFAALRPDDVLARFGVDGAFAQRLASGLEATALRGRAPRESFMLEECLEPPAEGVEATTFVAKRLAESLASELDRRGLSCSVLRAELVTTSGDRLVRTWSSEEATRPAIVAERLRWQLEAWITERTRRERPGWEAGEAAPDAGIDRVVLVPEEVVPATGRQFDLWSRTRSGDDQMMRAVVRVQGMLGPTAVVRPSLIGGRGPGERVALLGFDDGAKPRATPPARARHRGPDTASQPWPGRLPAPSPAVVACSAEPVALLDAVDAPVRVDGRGAMNAPPATLELVPTGRRSAVLAYCGPWPVDERWWEGARRRRRVRLQVVTATGEAYLLALERGTWHVEGSYD